MYITIRKCMVSKIIISSSSGSIYYRHVFGASTI